MRLALFGSPLSHSFSPDYFRNKFQQSGIEGTYVLADYKELNKEKLLDIIEDKNLDGFNVTIPYKQVITDWLDEKSEEVIKCGAVNTVAVIREGNRLKLSGYNTDVFGFAKSLAPVLQPYHQKAIILGTGGASKAVELVFKRMGIDYLKVSRNHSNEQTCLYEDLNEAIIKNFLLIVNTSPVGMFPNVEDAPLIPYQYLSSEHLLIDLIYNPSETVFLQKAASFKAKTLNGYGMLCHQADESWRIWQKLLITG